MPPENPTKQSFSAGRRFAVWINLFLAVAAILALVTMANYLSAAYYKRFDIASKSRLQLSAQTIKVLEAITNNVEATVFFDVIGEEEMYSQVAALLKEYHNVNPLLKVRSLDFIRFPGDAALFLSKYKLSGLENKNFILFDSNGQTKIIYENQLSDYDLNAVIRGETKEFRRIAFKGEMLFTSAIFTITHPRSLKAYFLQGHGEHDPENRTDDYGYGKFAALLKDENNVTWEKLSIAGTNEVPNDCQLLIIGGPAKAQLAENEIAAVDNYLSRGGRMLLLVNSLYRAPYSGAEKILPKWRLEVADDIVTDLENTATGKDMLTSQLHPSHEVTKIMFKEQLAVQLFCPRSFHRAIEASKSADTPDLQVIAATGTNAVAQFPIKQNGTVQYQNRTGVYPVIVAIERGNIKGVTADRGATRIMAIGESFCFDNRMLDSAANHYFAGFAVNWLLAQPSLLLEGLGPKPITEYRISLSASQINTLRWIFLAGLPGAILFCGGLVWLRRRK